MVSSTCDKCGEMTKVYKTFGSNICLECLKKRKSNIKGNSGMIYKKVNPNGYDSLFFKRLSLLKVPKSHHLYTMWYLEHYPKSKGIVGRQLNYLIYLNGKAIGIIGCASPPYNYKLFRQYFNVDNEKRYVNNNVFRIVKKPLDNNIGTKILKLFRNTIKVDYFEKYKDKLLGIVTFVELPRTGAIYKADNWQLIGKTQGIEVKRRGEDWLNKQYIKTSNYKLIFVKRFKNIRQGDINSGR